MGEARGEPMEEQMGEPMGQPASESMEDPWWSMLGFVWVPRDGRFPLPVEENAILRLSGHARDGLFPLPDEEKVISSPSP